MQSRWPGRRTGRYSATQLCVTCLAITPRPRTTQACPSRARDPPGRSTPPSPTGLACYPAMRSTEACRALALCDDLGGMHATKRRLGLAWLAWLGRPHTRVCGWEGWHNKNKQGNILPCGYYRRKVGVIFAR